MTTTGLEVFDSTVQKTNNILKDIEAAFGWQDRRDQSYDALRAVLQTLRDRLPVHEAANFGAQLPMLVRGMYYEGWKPEQVPIKMNREEFIARIRNDFPYDINVEITDFISTVITVLANHTDPEIIDNFKKMFPEDLSSLLK